MKQWNGKRGTKLVSRLHASPGYIVHTQGPTNVHKNHGSHSHCNWEIDDPTRQKMWLRTYIVRTRLLLLCQRPDPERSLSGVP